jgi:hypothetical protein
MSAAVKWRRLSRLKHAGVAEQGQRGFQYRHKKPHPKPDGVATQEIIGAKREPARTALYHGRQKNQPPGHADQHRDIEKSAISGEFRSGPIQLFEEPDFSVAKFLRHSALYCLHKPMLSFWTQIMTYFMTFYPLELH